MVEHAMTDPAGMFVIVAHQGYEFHAIDGCDLAAEDPAVWLISEGETVRPAWPSVNEWFRYWSPDIAEHRERLELMRETRPGRPPAGVGTGHRVALIIRRAMAPAPRARNEGPSLTAGGPGHLWLPEG